MCGPLSRTATRTTACDRCGTSSTPRSPQRTDESEAADAQQIVVVHLHRVHCRVTAESRGACPWPYVLSSSSKIVMYGPARVRRPDTAQSLEQPGGPHRSHMSSNGHATTLVRCACRALTPVFP